MYRRRYKLLQQVRKPVGGAASSDALEEAILLGPSDSDEQDSISSNNSVDDDDVPMLRVELTDIPSDDNSSLGDIALMERPLPLGAEDT